MSNPVSIFLKSSQHKSYLAEAAMYLAARGLSAQDVPIIPLAQKNLGLVDGNGMGWLAEGWAFCVKGKDGEVMDNQYLLRICNAPEKVYSTKNGELKEVVRLPKFVQTGKDPIIHYSCPESKVVSSPEVMLHEKITSSELGWKLLGIPCIAVSGCSGWSKGGEIIPEMRRLIGCLEENCRLLVCFDGDLLSNSAIQQAAGRLKAVVGTLRPDIEVVFPSVPTNPLGVGWDDWVVSQGDAAADGWKELLLHTGVEITDVIPSGWLISQYGVSFTDNDRLEQSLDNYSRLLNFPRWAGCKQDFNGDIYRDGGYLGGKESLVDDIYRWIERSVCRGYASGVNKEKLRSAVEGKYRPVSVVNELLRGEEYVSYEEAKAAAYRIAYEGLGVTGPMTEEHTEETILRMFRDITRRWGEGRNVSVQWIWTLIGPTGCGKSMASVFMFESLVQLGYARFPKTAFPKGSMVRLPELCIAARDSLVFGIDDYNPSDIHALDTENILYTLTSLRTTIQRLPYGRNTEELLLRAIYFLTTTDRTPQFLRSPKGSGERRFIPMEIKGVTEVDGVIRVNRDVLREEGRKLLVWSAQGGEGVGEGLAEEYSSREIWRYTQSAPGLVNVCNVDWGLFDEIASTWGRNNTDDYRFTTRMLATALGVRGKISNSTSNDLRNVAIEGGGRVLPQARVNGEGGRDIMKDNVISVRTGEWGKFVGALQQKL